MTLTKPASPPHFRVWYDDETGEVLGWASPFLAGGQRTYSFRNVDEADLPGWPTGYTVKDGDGGWARLIAPDGTVLDEDCPDRYAG